MPDLFSISAMFILFRETLEACIIVSVMLQLCVKLNLLKLRKWGESAPRSGCLRRAIAFPLSYYSTYRHRYVHMLHI